MAVSSRRTHALQKTGLSAIWESVLSGQMKEPVLYGYSKHYKSICSWGANDSNQHCGGQGCVTETSSTPISVVPEDSKEEAVLLSDVFRAKKSTEKAINKDLKFDFKAYQTKSRTVDLHLWPKPNTNAISTNKTLAEMMTLGYVMEELSKVGITPVVTSENTLQKNQIVKVPFGPMLDNHFQPAQEGQRLKASFVYNQFRLKKSMNYNDPWLSNIWLANALVLRIPEKEWPTL